ncbi:hypothetical protein FQA39_LY03395 [Lamprigera yunnana]|nr:hypothetical protein FQA39_LY03395 [Lamprigera yunnana]
MSNHELFGYVLVLLLLIFLVILIISTFRQLFKQMYSNFVCSQQAPDVWNISGQVPQDRTTSSDQRWPTHDHRLSIDSFVLTGAISRAQKDQIPPPLYCEVDLPTYEQATGCASPKNDVPSVHVTTSTSRSDHSHS